MRAIRLIPAAILTLVLTAGCQTRETEEPDAAGGDTDASAGVMEDVGAMEDAGAMESGGGAAGTEDARQAIAASNQRWEEAALAGDAAGVASLYADDAVLMPPGVPRAEGRAAIESALAAMFEAAPATSVSIESDATTFSESGELAYDVGTYAMAGTTPDGEAWEDKGKFIAVLKNVGGEWKIAADIWNSDAAPGM